MNKTTLLLPTLVLLSRASISSPASLTAHIGCAGGLGTERACAGDTITCVNTAKSDVPNRLAKLLVGYQEANGTVTPPVDVFSGALGPFFRLPLTSTPPFYVQEAAPNQELDVVYLINTEPDEVGPFFVQAQLLGQVAFFANNQTYWLNWSAGYGLRVLLVDCSGLSAFARTQIAQARPTVKRFHKMRVRRERHR